MPKSDVIRLHHMLDATRKAVEFSKDRQRVDLDTEELLALGLVRLIEVIGEAASKIETDTHDLYPDIPWRSIIGARNRFIHGYDDVDLDIVWSIITNDLPPLAKQLEQAIESEESE